MADTFVDAYRMPEAAQQLLETKQEYLRRIRAIDGTIDMLRRPEEPEQPRVPKRRQALAARIKILALMAQDKDRVWTVIELADEFVRQGDDLSSVDPDSTVRAAVVDAVKAGEIRRLGRGQYQLATSDAQPASLVAAVMQQAQPDMPLSPYDQAPEVAAAHEPSLSADVVWICHTSPGGYRSDWSNPWGQIVAVVWDTDPDNLGPCYQVRFEDGTVVLWPVGLPCYRYAFPAPPIRI